MKRSIPLVVVLVAVASTALAAPRGAGSKTSGSYTTFDVPAAAARSQFYGPTAPSPAAAAPLAGERSFSYEPSAGTQSSTSVGPCQSDVAPVQPGRSQAVRSFSYEPGSDVRTYEPVPRRRSAKSAIRGAGSKIQGEY